jgi:hypothetical protein
VEAPALALVGGHDAACEQQFGGPALTDLAGQDGAGPHVAAGQADTGEEERGLRARRGYPQVRGHGHDGTGPDTDAVEGRDHRLGTAAHGLDQIAGHPGEGEQGRHVHFGQGADDLVHVAAG